MEQRKADYRPYKRVTINVSGLRFETRLKTLERFPDTLLGDPKRRESYYDAAQDEYVFETDRDCFDAILYYYQSNGTLLRPPTIQFSVFWQEVKFYELGVDATKAIMETEGIQLPKPRLLPGRDLHRKIWLIVDDEQSSKAGRAFGLISFLVTVVSVVSCCLHTLPRFKHYVIKNATNVWQKLTITEDVLLRHNEFVDIVEVICVAWFTFALLVRFCVCPSKKDFFKNILNIVDIMVIGPYFTTLIVDTLVFRNVHLDQTVWTIFAVLKLAKIFVVCDVIRFISGLRIIGKTIYSIRHYLSLLFFFYIVLVFVFSVLIYLFEHRKTSTGFTSIPITMWFTVTTMTTVGYGDHVPEGIPGRIVCSISALFGILAFGLFSPSMVRTLKLYISIEKESEGNGNDWL